MQLAWFFACTAPVTAFLILHHCLSMIRTQGSQGEAQVSGVFTAFTLLYVVTTILALTMT